jgi:hypothetical protein
VQETPEDLDRLTALLNDSIDRAGAFLRSSFEMPEKSLSANQLVTYLHGIQTIAFATTTAAGEPRVAPIGSLFFRGAFYIPTVTTAARSRHIQRRPAVSLTHYQGNDLAVIAHGQASLLTSRDPRFANLEALHRSFGSSSVNDWGEGAFIHVEARSIFTYARFPDRFPERHAEA